MIALTALGNVTMVVFVISVVAFFAYALWRIRDDVEL